ncbi:MAG: hypothetical protein EXR36_04180 [Betaproteobacteria bacterium]|nr:hypothetical protein [Betaproteobacteria bacterium]
MIPGSELDFLRGAAGQYPAAQFLQGPLNLSALANGGSELQAPPPGDSSEVNLSDASKLLGLMDSDGGGSASLLSAFSALVEKLAGQKVFSLTVDSQKLETSYFTLDTVKERLRVGAGASPLDYRYSAFHAEAQTLSYSAQGTLTLEDGTKLQFSFQLEAAQVYVEETQARVRIDGSWLPAAQNAASPGMSVRSRDNGADIALDHHGVRQLLDGLALPGHRHAYGHDKRDAVLQDG